MAKIYNISAISTSKKVNLATSEGIRRKKILLYLRISIGINVVLGLLILYLKLKITT